MTSNTLRNLFEHNLWANLRLFDRCTLLNTAQLATADPAAFGTIQATLAHIVSAEQSYVWRLQGQPATWHRVDTQALSIAQLRPLVAESGAQLIDLAAIGDTLAPVERKDEQGKISLIPAPFILTQAIHHGNEHRTNITTILATLGIRDSALSGWDFWLAQS